MLTGGVLSFVGTDRTSAGQMSSAIMA